MSDKTLLREAREAIGGFLWLGNNLHQIKASPDEFRRLYEAALGDARATYDKLAALDDKSHQDRPA